MSVIEALTAIPCPLFGTFLEPLSIVEGEDSTFGEVFDGKRLLTRRIGVITFHHPGQIVVGGGAGLDVLEMLLQGGENVFWKDLGLQVGEKQLGKGLLPLFAVGLQTTPGIILVNGVMGQLMDKSDQHLIGIEVAVQRDAANAFSAPWPTKIA